MTLGRENEGADAHRIVGLARTVLQIGIPGSKAASFRRQRHEVTMDAPGGRVDEGEVSVNVGRLELRPLAVFLHHFKQRHKLRTMYSAPFRQHHHRLVIGSLGVFLSGFQYRQAQRFEQIVLECLCGGVGSNIHVANHGPNALADFQQPGSAFALLADHGSFIHEQAVVFHQAAVYRCWGFHLLHNIPVPGQGLIEPAVEQLIQPQRIVGIGTGIAHGFGRMGRKLVEEPSFGNFLKRGQFITDQLRHQLLETAIRQAAEFKRGLERQLRGGDGVIAGRLHDDVQCIQEHGLKGQIVGNLHNQWVCPQCIAQKVDNLRGISILSDEVLQRHIDGRAFLNRQ